LFWFSFTDAISLNISELRRYSTLALLDWDQDAAFAALVALVAGVCWACSSSGYFAGAALASTDPVCCAFARREIFEYRTPGVAT